VNLLKIAPLTIDRLDAVVELDRLCFGELWTAEGYKRELESPNSYLVVLTLSQSNLDLPEKTIGLGCFWTILEEAHITILAIDPNYQNQGLGQLIFCHLLENAAAQSLERATLEVRDSNQSALYLYQKFGFKIAGRRKNYYQKTGEDALVLWRNDLKAPEFQEKLALWQQENEIRLDRANYRLARSTYSV
jgi:ribosomal-protein-alanine N-acetyltransferase